MAYFDKVKGFALEIGLKILKEDSANEILILSDPANGISSLVTDCEEGLLIMEHVAVNLPGNGTADQFSKLLKANRTLVHGSFALDDTGKTVLWRDTLELANLDLNEFQGSINAVGMAFAEHHDLLISLSKPATAKA